MIIDQLEIQQEVISEEQKFKKFFKKIPNDHPNQKHNLNPNVQIPSLRFHLARLNHTFS